MSEAPKRGIVFRDPVHQLIQLDEDDAFLRDLIDTRPFQRLRRIRQLGVSSLTYHGAEHSRFSHSMGVLHVASLIINSLRRQYREFDSIKAALKENRRTVFAAALLHDIGHAPFSHAMERLFPANADHEARSVQLIRNPEFRIFTILERAGVDPEDVASILLKIHPKRFLTDIVSSQLDADRMDYLLRDSLFTGVEYGHYDLDWVSNHLCLGREPLSGDGEEDSEARLRLCLDGKRGLYAAEQLIIARFHMTMQVYFHRTTRMWEAMLLCLLQRASGLVQEEAGNLFGEGSILPGTPAPFREFLESQGAVSDEVFLKLDDATFLAAFHSWSDSSDSFVAEVSAAFLHRHKTHLPEREKKLFQCYDLSNADPVNIGKLLGALGNEDEFPRYLWEDDDIEEWAPYKDFFKKFRGTQGAELDDATSSILLSDGDLSTISRPAELASFLFESMGEETVSVRRLYAHHSLCERIDSLMKEFNLA